MTKLDAVIERLKELPEDEKDALAHEIESLIAPLQLTPAQWAEIDRRLAEDHAEGKDHNVVIGEMKQRFGC